MQGASFALVANIAVAAVFAASFAIVAVANPGRRSALWFSASYAVGMLTPLSELMVRLSANPDPFVLASYLTFAAGLFGMTLALAKFYGQPIPVRLVGALFVCSAATRLAIWGGPRDDLFYEFAYQTPFAVASLASMAVILRVRKRRRLDVALASLFGVIAAHFLVKPLLAHVFGSGLTAKDYATSVYALLSQTTTGILLLACGVFLLLVVAQAAIGDAQREADTDPLSGLVNRRGFDKLGAEALARVEIDGRPLAALMLDIDHFKAINDAFGHAAGDEVIRDLAGMLARALPPGAVVARTGGEEFAALIEGETDDALAAGEAVRVAVQTAVTGPAFTVSVGATTVRPGEGLSDAMRRADDALYRAKAGGRNQVVLAEPSVGDAAPLPAGGSIKPFRRGRTGRLAPVATKA